MLAVLSNPAFTAGSPYTVTRTAIGTRTQGRYTPGSTSQFAITASVQPVTGRDLQVLPEAQHAEDVRVVYATTEIKTQEAGFEPDQISIDGALWKVVNVEKWTLRGETHYRALVARRAP